jgi:hypothetical protein
MVEAHPAGLVSIVSYRHVHPLLISASREDLLALGRIHVEACPLAFWNKGKVDGQVGNILLERLVDAILRILALLS